MAGNALSLGSLWVELGLRTDRFHETLSGVTRSLESTFQGVPSALRELGRALNAGEGKNLADAFESLVSNGLSPPLIRFADDIENLIPSAVQRVADDLGATSGPVMTIRSVFGTDIPSDVGVTATAIQNLRNDVRGVEQASLDVKTALETPPTEPSLFSTLRSQAGSLGDFLASDDGLTGTIQRVFAFDLPRAVGDGFGGVLALQDDFSTGWTRFTNSLKRAWRDALGDMLASFAQRFTQPVGEQLSSIVSSVLPSTAGTAASNANALASNAGDNSNTSDGARQVARVVGTLVGAELIGQTLRAAGFSDAFTPSNFGATAVQAFSEGGGSQVGFTGKRVANSFVPDAAWQALFPTAFVKTPEAMRHDILDWRLGGSRSRRDLTSLHPHSRTGGTLRGVRLTVITTTMNVVPTQIGQALLMNGGLTPTEVGVDARWIGVGNGTHIAIFPEGEGLKFLEVGADASGGGMAQPVGDASAAAAPSNAGTIMTGGGNTAALTAPKIAAMPQTFAQGMAVLRQEQERDLSGAGILDFRQQTALSRGLGLVRGALADAVSSTGISLGSIRIPGSDSTFGDVVTGFSRSSASFAPGALLQVNVDKFFGTDPELRQLTDEIIRIARQEGLVLNPIV